MNRLFAIVKIVALVLVLGTSYIGYNYFRVWQKNVRPVASNISFDSENVILGKPVILNATVQVPWHREIKSSVPTRSPKSLVASVNGGKLNRGQLDLSGHRSWEVSIPLVASSVEKIEAQVIEIPMNRIRRLSSNTVTIALPKLEIAMPEDVADKLVFTDAPMKPDTPVPDPPEITEAEKKPFPFALAAGIVAVLIVLFLVLKWIRRPKPVIPPWVTAQLELDELNQNPPGEPSLFFLRLTDILKRYTAQRFDTPADAASSTELLATLSRVPAIDTNLKAPLTKVVRQADSVKFASANVESDACNHALGKVREFVDTTTPEEEEVPANA